MSLEEFLRTWDPPSTFRGALPLALRWLFVDDAGARAVEFASTGAHVLPLIQRQVGAAVDVARPAWGPQTWSRVNDAATMASATSGIPYDPPARDQVNRDQVRWALALTFHRGRADRVVLPRSLELPAFNVVIPHGADVADPLVARTVYQASPADAGCYYQSHAPLVLWRSEATEGASSVTLGAGETVEILAVGTLTRGDARTYRVRTRGGFVGFAWLRPADVARCPLVASAPPAPGVPAPPAPGVPAPPAPGVPAPPAPPARPSSGWGWAFGAVGLLTVVGGGFALAGARGRRVAG